MNVLVVDVGGSHVKLMASGASEPRQFDSGEHLTPELMVAGALRLAADWSWDVVALGYPGAVDADGPTAEPGNLSTGWVGYDFEAAFAKPVRIVNDAVLQALGAYDGGRMLFLGFGTGLGSTLVTEHVVIPLELGCLPYAGATVADSVGREGLERLGETAWVEAVREVSAVLREALAADYMVFGGGNAERIDPLPEGARRGARDAAFAGGFRLWEELVEPHDQQPAGVWRVVR